MRKIKKIFAMLLALTMLMGMSVTTFAEGATLTVTDADKEAVFKKLQVIEADPETATGWNFTSGEAASAYISAFGTVGEDEEGVSGATAVSDQEAIAMLILAANPKAKLPTDLQGVSAATAGQISRALANVKAMLVDEFISMTNGESASEAGVYAVTATEEGWTYNNMAIYVGFGPAADGTYPALTSEPVAAKRASHSIKKENLGEAADNAVAVGDTVNFKITASFPYINPDTTDQEYRIQDTLAGAEFDLGSVVVTIGGRDYTRVVTPALVTEKEEENLDGTQIGEGEGNPDGTQNDTKEKNPDKTQTLEIDLSGLIDNENSLAGREVVITYSATVTEVSVTNTVNHTTTDVTGSTPATTHLYTGSITITKFTEDGTTALKDAEFVVVKPMDSTVDEDGGDNFDVADNSFEYATFDTTGGHYVLSGWVKDIEGATHVKTGADGKATVEGLDANNYAFIEVKAPEGYSINEEASIVELDFEGTKAQALFTAETTMKDTKLSSLPSTGGIGTTIFTLGGCAIMILAVGLYFALRRKTEK